MEGRWQDWHTRAAASRDSSGTRHISRQFTQTTAVPRQHGVVPLCSDLPARLGRMKEVYDVMTLLLAAVGAKTPERRRSGTAAIIVPHTTTLLLVWCSTLWKRGAEWIE